MAPSSSSLIALLTLALSTSQVVSGLSPKTHSSQAELCRTSELSCHNTTIVQDICCFNAPGGLMLLTQFWDTNPGTGPVDSWTVHGLWPDNCDGTWEEYCDPNREYTNITQILQSYGVSDLLSYMNGYWKDYRGNDESFWAHEWNKHGTCISTLEPSCYVNYMPQEDVVDYFQRTIQLFEALPSYEILANASILPSTTRTYTLSEIQSALSVYHGNNVTIGCSNGALDEIWYYFNVRGSVQTGQFISTSPDHSSSPCPDTGIYYYPKNYSTATTSTAVASITVTPSATVGPFAGRGRLMVEVEGAQQGCIISYGTWYTSGTCAIFTATTVDTDAGFTLTSSKGHCAVFNGALTCSSSVADGTTFTGAEGLVAVDGSTSFYADEVPNAGVQGAVYTAQRAIEVRIRWQSA